MIISDHFLNTFHVFASLCPTLKGIAYTEMLQEKWMWLCNYLSSYGIVEDRLGGIFSKVGFEKGLLEWN